MLTPDNGVTPAAILEALGQIWFGTLPFCTIPYPLLQSLHPFCSLPPTREVDIFSRFKDC